MKKTIRIFLLVMILSSMILPLPATAKSNKAVYYSSSLKTKEHWGEKRTLRKIVFKKKKIITYGSFDLTKSNGRTVYRRNKKRVFKINKKTKYYLVDVSGYYRCSQKVLRGYLLNMGLIIKVRNGRAVALMITP